MSNQFCPKIQFFGQEINFCVKKLLKSGGKRWLKMVLRGIGAGLYGIVIGIVLGIRDACAFPTPAAGGA